MMSVGVASVAVVIAFAVTAFAVFVGIAAEVYAYLSIKGSAGFLEAEVVV